MIWDMNGNSLDGDLADLGILRIREHTTMATRYSRAGAYAPDRETELMLDYSTRLMKERFEAQPPERQKETLERVVALLTADRHKAQRSVLWRLARVIYGIDPELLDGAS